MIWTLLFSVFWVCCCDVLLLSLCIFYYTGYIPGLILLGLMVRVRIVPVEIGMFIRIYMDTKLTIILTLISSYVIWLTCLFYFLAFRRPASTNRVSFLATYASLYQAAAVSVVRMASVTIVNKDPGNGSVKQEIGLDDRRLEPAYRFGISVIAYPTYLSKRKRFLDLGNRITM